ncbi:MAG: GDP-mannose 4,6-dehydratase [Candidatus Orphnella occulta]|nr:GDP-mannose 4,6-dehydratase [Candidatus Orphnella occulta]
MKNRKQLKIGLSGSSGFLGGAIMSHLRSQGDVVIALDELVYPEGKSEEPNIPENIDWVLHFGATKSIKESFLNPIHVYRSNINSTISALDIAIATKARFLYMSSYVYGEPDYLPIDEAHPTSALNPYMGSKLLGEQICLQFHQCMGISAIILRGFTFYGPQQKGEQLIPSAVESIRNLKTIVVKDPNPIRDYLYISDFVKLLEKIVRSGFSGYDVYNVGGAQGYKNLEVAEIANNIAGHSVKIHIEGKERRNDVIECYANIEKVMRDFNWRPETDLHTGLNDCLSSH